MRSKEQGFSLIELMVAMVVTLMVTGAVYGLLTGGQNAFRREPGLSDRQQNIRLAMDLITRDVASAGAGMPDFIQTFTPGLDGGSLTACQDNSGTSVTCPTGSSGNRTDELEIMANPDDVAPEYACNNPGSSNNAFMVRGTTIAQPNMVVMAVMTDGTWTMRNVVNTGSNNTSSGNCTSGINRASLGFNPGLDPTGMNTASGLCTGTPVNDANGNCTSCTGMVGTTCCPGSTCVLSYFLFGEIIRYRIRVGSDGVPNLERFSSGSATTGFSTSGVRQFQVVARGIEDFQVSYTSAGNVQTVNAPVVDQTQLRYDTLIRRVTVTLSARSDVQNVAGMQTAAGGQPNAMRGSLASDITPRAVLAVLGRPQTARKPGWTGATWN